MRGRIHFYLGALRSVLQTLWHPEQRGTTGMFYDSLQSAVMAFTERERSIIWWGWVIHWAVHLLKYTYCSVLLGQEREILHLNHFVCFLVINIDTIEPRSSECLRSWDYGWNLTLTFLKSFGGGDFSLCSWAKPQLREFLPAEQQHCYNERFGAGWRHRNLNLWYKVECVEISHPAVACSYVTYFLYLLLSRCLQKWVPPIGFVL